MEAAATSGIVMTQAEIRARVAGLLTLALAAAEGTVGDDDFLERSHLLGDDLRTLQGAFVGLDPAYREAMEAVADTVQKVYALRIDALQTAFMSGAVELARALTEATGDPQTAADTVQSLALYWASQTPPEAPSRTD